MPLVITRKVAPSGLDKWGATITAQGTGWKKLQDRLQKYTKDFALDWANNQANNIAQNHLEFAKALCPKRTGDLADSLHLTVDYTEGVELNSSSLTKFSRAGFQSGDKTAAGGPLSVGSQFTGETIRAGSDITARSIRQRYYLTADDPAAVHVEYGTSTMPAQPFMRPAYAFAKELFIRRLRIWAIERARVPA